MIYSPTLMAIIHVLLVVVPVLLAVAYITVAERKTMASMQRRLGPNVVGYYGSLQAFGDALKLLLKEYVAPTQANLSLFFLGPIITLVFSLYGYAVIPYGPGLAISDFNLGILFMLAVSSLSTYGILLAGWSANSKYAFLGSLRSTAQLISYELILSSAILLVIMLSGSLNLTVNIEAQRAVWFILPLFPVFIIFLIGSIAETNRAPFDLAEAESELVSGFMTEHAAVIFVFFLLAEYASIVLICTLISVLFLGGYLYDYLSLLSIFNIMDSIIQIIENIILLCFNIIIFIYNIYIYLLTKVFNISYYILGIDPRDFIFMSLYLDTSFEYYKPFLDTYQNTYMGYYEYYVSIYYSLVSNPIVEGLLYGLALGIKACIIIFIFIWARASFPRIRFDQLMSFCWVTLLPIVISFVINVPTLLVVNNIMPCNFNLL